MRSDNIYISNLGEVSRIFKMLAKANNIDINNYNLNKMSFYNCKGYDLIGSSANTKDSRRHFLVKNNHYTVYEIPFKEQKKVSMTGKFLVLIHNNDFNFWSLSDMSHSFVQYRNILKEDVDYYCYGEYRITESNGLMHWFCTTGEGYCCRGFRTRVFDSDNVRKEKGYHTTMKVINKIFNIKNI